MIIWDTGEYEVLPYKREETTPETETETESESDGESTMSASTPVHQKNVAGRSEALREAFRDVYKKAVVLSGRH